MNVLVTGATGFLGRFLTEALRTRGNQVVALGSRQADLTAEDSLARFTQPFDVVFHLAAWTQAGDFCLHHAGEQWIINQKINTNVLHWWHNAQPQAKLVSMGTSCSYDPALALSEDNYLTGKPIDSLFTYAMTKRMLHAGKMALHRQYGHRYLTVVPSTLYGPNYHEDGRQMHFIFDLIRKILRGKMYGETVSLWGDGHQRRELIHVRDFTELLLNLTASHDNDIVNIGAGQDFTIREFASLICDIAGYDPDRIGYDTSRYVGARSKMLDTAKLQTMIPEFTWTSLRQGLRETIDWFIENSDRILPPDLDRSTGN